MVKRRIANSTYQELDELRRYSEKLESLNSRLHREIFSLKKTADYYKKNSEEKGKRISELKTLLRSDIKPIILSLLKGERVSQPLVHKVAGYLGMFAGVLKDD